MIEEQIYIKNIQNKNDTMSSFSTGGGGGEVFTLALGGMWKK